MSDLEKRLWDGCRCTYPGLTLDKQMADELLACTLDKNQAAATLAALRKWVESYEREGPLVKSRLAYEYMERIRRAILNKESLNLGKVMHTPGGSVCRWCGTNFDDSSCDCPDTDRSDPDE